MSRTMFLPPLVIITYCDQETSTETGHRCSRPPANIQAPKQLNRCRREKKKIRAAKVFVPKGCIPKRDHLSS